MPRAHFRIAPESGPLSSAGITPHPRYYEPIRHPADPACPSRGVPVALREASNGVSRAAAREASNRASRVAASFIFHACWRQYPGGSGPVRLSLASRLADGLPLLLGESASALGFSRPA